MKEPFGTLYRAESTEVSPGHEPPRVGMESSTKLAGQGAMIGIVAFAVSSLILSVLLTYRVAANAQPKAQPTVESAIAAEEKLARALQDNDADGIARSLSDDWAVISARGGVGEGKSIFPEGIKQGYLTHKAYEVSEPRVRLYGNVALVTTKVHNAGAFRGKPFDVMERETDVWLWKDGSWKCVLTHEAWEGPEKDQRQLSH